MISFLQISLASPGLRSFINLLFAITHADIDKIVKKIGWKPKVSFNLGVKEMLSNIDYWKNAPLWNTSKINKATKTWFKYMSNHE